MPAASGDGQGKPSGVSPVPPACSGAGIRGSRPSSSTRPVGCRPCSSFRLSSTLQAGCKVPSQLLIEGKPWSRLSQCLISFSRHSHESYAACCVVVSGNRSWRSRSLAPSTESLFVRPQLKQHRAQVCALCSCSGAAPGDDAGRSGGRPRRAPGAVGGVQIRGADVQHLHRRLMLRRAAVAQAPQQLAGLDACRVESITTTQYYGADIQ